MAESSLAIQYKELKARVGSFLGYGRGADYGDPAWDSKTTFEIEGVVASGLRQFYFPPRLETDSSSYDWSFLRPTVTADFPANASTILLPDDFGGFEGKITILTTTSTSQPWNIQWKNEGSIRELYSTTPNMTGPPMFACERPLKGTVGDFSQRFQLLLFPISDMDYTLQFTYFINPDYLSGAFPYAYGGPPHAETVLESCLAVAEMRLDDAIGPHGMKWMERLQASVSMDRRHKPQKIGYNEDRSDIQGFDRSDVHYWAPQATYNGGSFQ